MVTVVAVVATAVNKKTSTLELQAEARGKNNYGNIGASIEVVVCSYETYPCVAAPDLVADAANAAVVVANYASCSFL